MDEPPELELEQPLDPAILATPEMQRKIARARELAADPRSEGGSTAEDLKKLADEIRRLATPT